jgi:hypothetical protein
MGITNKWGFNMKTINTLSVVLVVVALAGCGVATGKKTVADRQSDGATARAYTQEKTADGQTKWVKLETQPTTAMAATATPKNLSDIETAAGPGATPVATQTNESARLGYTPGEGYNNN